ncbi:MAG: universal stress protein [Boseongicola sp.]|nr:universal stress protein [Boseongicola sp.]
MFSTILLSYDGSDHAQNALKAAAGLAKALNADLHLSHTPQIDTPTIVAGPFVSALEKPPTDEEVVEAGRHVVDQAKALAAKAGVEFKVCHVGRGRPAQHTLADAEAIGADLIVMGRRGLGAVGALAMGSVSQAVSHGAKCACMTVV